MKLHVWLTTHGDGEDGNEWGVLSIHATEQGAYDALAEYSVVWICSDGSINFHEGNVEKWEVEK